MKSVRILVAGLGISLLLHGAGSAYFAKDPDDVSIAASQGGAVSVIGSIEDMVAGAKVEAVEAEKPVDEVEPLEEVVEPIQEPVEIERLKPVEEVVQPVIEPEKVKPVEMERPVEITAVEPVTPLTQVTETIEPVTASAAVPVVEGVTTTEKVTEPVTQLSPKVDQVTQEQVTAKPVANPVKAVATPETQPSKPVKAAPQQPVQMALAVPPEVQPAQEAVRPVAEQLQAVPETVRTPVAKPKPPVRKAEPARKKKPEKQQAKRQQNKGSETSSRKGGEQVTSKTARSNANGRADAKTKDGGSRATLNWRGKVRSKLSRAQRYPSAANRKRLTGVVVLAFTVSRSGSVSNVRIARSSGHQILDKAALDMARRASPMPKMPKGIKHNKETFTVPVKFQPR